MNHHEEECKCAPIVAADRQYWMRECRELVSAFKQLRAKIHACNRGQIPNSTRVEWRDFIDKTLWKHTR